MTPKASEELLGFRVDTSGLDGCVQSAVEWIRTGDSCRWLACINPHSFVVAQREARFAEALRGADWLIPDGVGILFASRLLGGNIRERVTGSDVFLGVLGALELEGGAKVFLLGSTEETLALMKERMARDFPASRVAGTLSPPFRERFTADEVSEMISRINDSGATVLWVGMTAPKQETWIFEHRSHLRVRFAGAIGAVFDFYSGKVKRSHPGFQRLGLEWLPRLVQQPRRLWRRTFVSAPAFLAAVLRERRAREPWE